MALPISAPPERRKGFSPLQNESLWDWPRLVSGDAQVLSILFINSELHVPREKGTPALKWTRPISNEELAAYGRCTVRAIETAFKDLTERKVVLAKKTGPGVYKYSIPFETWPELPDRPPKVVVLAEAQPSQEETEEEANKPRGEIEALYEKPQIVRPGGRTRKKELPNGKSASWIRMEVDDDSPPQQFYPYLQDGIIVVRVKGETIANDRRTKGAESRNKLRKQSRQTTDNKQNVDLNPLHELLDDYCRRHHGTIPNDKLLTKVHSALGTATIGQFKTIVQARIRSGKVVPMPWFINLAEDAAAVAREAGEPVECDAMGRPRRKMSRE